MKKLRKIFRIFKNKLKSNRRKKLKNKIIKFKKKD